MEPFNPKAKCPKCGGEDIYSSYHNDDYQVHCVWNTEGALIERGCRRCSFKWPEAPLDAKESEPHGQAG